MRLQNFACFLFLKIIVLRIPLRKFLLAFTCQKMLIPSFNRYLCVPSLCQALPWPTKKIAANKRDSFPAYIPA